MWRLEDSQLIQRARTRREARTRTQPRAQTFQEVEAREKEALETDAQARAFIGHRRRVGQARVEVALHG